MSKFLFGLEATARADKQAGRAPRYPNNSKYMEAYNGYT